jgi:hypothetical protein
VGRIQTIDAHVYFIYPDDSRETESETEESIPNLQRGKIEDDATFPRLCSIAGSIVLGRIHVAVLSEPFISNGSQSMLLPPLLKSIDLLCISSHITNFLFDFILIRTLQTGKDIPLAGSCLCIVE